MFFYITQGLRIEETRKSCVFFRAAIILEVEPSFRIFEDWIVAYGLVVKKLVIFFLDFLHENQASTPYKIECTPSVVM